ncbi:MULTISPECIES: universal stress protein [Sphingobium]|uniref:universal stress protein n=1 Tax=Sphingobium sp. MI1205 TaxID=407020 RepID=UPI00076FFCD8|nr:universal stress protein [Sphingobium sp. MI1205]AMK19747.1 UspA domain-containing protein [Sphingobium sp. MI1205]
MKSVLLHIRDDLGAESRLQAACDIVRATNGRIHCVQVTAMPDFIGADMYGGAAIAPEVMAELREEDERTRGQVEDRLRREGVNWEWTHMDGDVIHGLLSAATLADVIIVTLPERRSNHVKDPLNLAGALALGGRTPVLAMPQTAKSLPLSGVAAIAWDGSQEASAALRLASPLLKLAEQVHIVSVEEAGKYPFPATQACEYLALHGIRSELHSVSPDGRTVPQALEAKIAGLKPDWIAMGAFGHSRMREFVFGGVTRTMLDAARLPLLLAH